MADVRYAIENAVLRYITVASVFAPRAACTVLFSVNDSAAWVWDGAFSLDGLLRTTRRR